MSAAAARAVPRPEGSRANNADEQAVQRPIWPPTALARSRSRLFHVKQRRGSIASSALAAASGSAKTNLIAPFDHPDDLDPAHRRFAPAPGARAGRQMLGRSRLRRRLSRPGDRLRARRTSPAPRSIWSKATARRPPSCARPRSHIGSAGRGPCCANRGFREELRRAARRRHRARAGSARRTARARASAA